LPAYYIYGFVSGFVIENPRFPGLLRKDFWKPAISWLVFVFSCGIFSDIGVWLSEEGG
jgi:hypothetical protein